MTVGYFLDGWLSKSTESFLGVTCHYIDLDFYLRNLVLTLKYLNDKHSTEFIHQNIQQVLNDWKLDDKVNFSNFFFYYFGFLIFFHVKIVAMVYDSGSYFKKVLTFEKITRNTSSYRM
jgi:hypothetical protein